MRTSSSFFESDTQTRGFCLPRGKIDKLREKCQQVPGKTTSCATVPSGISHEINQATSKTSSEINQATAAGNLIWNNTLSLRFLRLIFI